MRWIAISGGWRKTNEKVEKDIRKTVKEIISQGNGIISGGALGVDYLATNEALKLNPSANQIKIYLPTTLTIYAKHYRKRANEKVITHRQAEALILQLKKLKKANKNALIKNTTNNVVNKETYYERNSRVIDAADALVAFHINESKGTQDTITKAEKKGIPIKKSVYNIS